MGIDPGSSSGAICLIQGEQLVWWKMPKEAAAIADVLREAIAEFGMPRGVLEKVHAGGGETGGDGKRKMGTRSAFSFGENFGALQGILSALSVPHELVRPPVWKSALGLKKARKQTPSETKAQEHAAALRLWPAHKVPKYVAASVLLAEYSRRVVWPDIAQMCNSGNN